MKYIKEYNIFKINEKISWYEMLIILGITYFGVRDISKNIQIHNKLTSIYNDINSPKSEPVGKELKQVELIRSQLIEKVSKMNRFKKFNQNWILDSLKTIHFKILDNMTEFGTKNSSAVGCYIYLPGFKKDYPLHHKILSPPIFDNVIIIDRRLLNDSDCADVVTHELYHYIDRLTGGVKTLSDKIDISQFLDKEIMTNKLYGAKKLVLINGATLDGASSEKIKDVENILDMFNFNYLTSNEELFARWETFKLRLLKNGYINNINECPTIDDISNYILDKNVKISEEDASILLILDWTKFEDLDNAINNN